MPEPLGNVLASHAVSQMTGSNGSSGSCNTSGLQGLFTQILNGIQSLLGMNAGNTSIGSDLLAYAANAIASQLSSSSGGSDVMSMIAGVLNSITSSSGSPLTNPIDSDSEAGERIAQCAQQMVGQSTADNPATQGGALGCALAVSRILDCAGYGVGTHVSTVALYEALENDPCYDIVDTGHITPEDAMGLQPGDVLVTKRGSRAGHTGIYVGNGKIISNSSSGFQGSAPGTIQQNYTVTNWKKVTNRNPSGSAVFRRNKSCSGGSSPSGSSPGPSNVTDCDKALLDLINSAESGSGNYNVVFGGSQPTIGGRPLSQWTVGEVQDWQSRTSGDKAVGRYQFIQSTFNELVSRNPNINRNTVFDQNTQDALAIQLANQNVRLDRYKNGQQSLQGTIDRFSKTWAGLENSPDGGYHDGFNGNKAKAGTYEQLKGILESDACKN
jgi:muramidase (phage lysozyme)